MFLALENNKNMGKFNTTSPSTKVMNKAGGMVYKESDKLAFVSLLLTSLLKEQYYRSEDDTTKELVELLNRIPDKKFLAKASIYARNEFGMRSITHIVGAELAKEVKGQTWMRPYLIKNFHRVDDMIETLAYYENKYGRKPIPNSLREAIKKAFDKFDSYQLNKYQASDKKIKLLDLINYTHPIATEKNKEAIAGIIAGTLKASGTVMSELSKAGRDAEDDVEKGKMKADVWKKLLTEKKIGYFALVKNLRNIVEQAPDMIDQACALLEDEAMIKKSLLFPFRFVTAVKQLQQDGVNEPRIYKSLNVALEKSFGNVPKLDGRTLVAVDHSGSMDSNSISKQLTNFDIGALFGITLAKSNNADILYFGDIAKYAAINPMDSTPTLINYLNGLNQGSRWSDHSGTQVGHGTNISSIFQEANKAYDRICIFSDLQSWRDGGSSMPALETYKKRTGVNPKIYSFDLSGYGTLTFPEDNVYCVAGFSDKILGLMRLLESDKHALLNTIESVEL